MSSIYIDKIAESISVAEQIVLASVIIDGNLIGTVRNILEVRDFINTDHGIIFESCLYLNNESIEVNLVAVTEHLNRIGRLNDIGGPGYLVDITDNVGSTSQCIYYANIVKESSLSRQYAKLTQKFSQQANQSASGKLGLANLIESHIKEIKSISDTCKRASAEKIDWRSADPNNVYQIKWPLGLEQWVNLFSKNIAIVAGASNAGKTAFLLNVALMNCKIHRIKYFSSEMGPEELRLRLELFGNRLSDWDSIDFIDRSSDFAPLIDPDALNIVDYLEISDNFFAIGAEIKDIFDQLKTRIAVIAIQKKSSSVFARGGEFTLEKARLYVSLDPGVAKIIKGKNWAQTGVNPKDKEFTYQLLSGCKFLNLSQG